jgi:hypothetical protein
MWTVLSIILDERWLISLQNGLLKNIHVFIYLFIYFLREEGLFLLSFSVHHGKAEINILTSRKQRGEKYKKGSGKNIS